MNRSPTTGERPRAEPEIIPPERQYERSAPIGVRIHVTRLGPFTSMFVALGLVLLCVILLVVVAGALLFWIPVIGLIVAAAIVANALRGGFRRTR